MRPSRAKTPARSAAYPRLNQQTPGPKKENLSRSSSMSESDEVSVFCRVRPLDVGSVSNSNSNTSDSDSSDYRRCIEVQEDLKSLQLVAPESSRSAFLNGGIRRATKFSFSTVFDEESNQKLVFQETAFPLVKDLLNGRNGLLFTYGVTGSGKTHTMQGNPMDPGLMVRCIDVIFNSIDDRLVSRKHLIVSDRFNDFQLQSVADAAQMTQQELMDEIKRPYCNRNNTSDPNLSRRLPDDTKVDDVDRKQVYAVFISYCEIYNKYIYDLLENTSARQKFTSRTLREDAHGNMFVSGATEVEVRSPKEALEAFYKGQQRRRVAQTQLNHESSRSHSVFNIRLVKCHPLDKEEVDAEKPCLVSQLALVDLAGSERTSRTGNTGDRLREAGNINNSLMNLRNCIERLRENQKTNRNCSVPYRNDKLTHLFKNYFEGNGSVKMIVCVNPKSTDYEETMNVLSFAEMAQEIEIERHDPIKREFHREQVQQQFQTPSRQRAEKAFQDALNTPKVNVDFSKLNPDFDPIYNLGPAWPDLEFEGENDDDTLGTLQRYLHQRITTRNTLLADFTNKLDHFRTRLVDSEKELVLLKDESGRLKTGWDGDKRRVRDVEKRLVNAEAANNSLQRRVDAFCQQKVVLENELDEKELLLNQQKKETKRTVKKLQSQLSQVDDMRRKRSMDDQQAQEADFRGVGSRIAAMEARVNGVNSGVNFITPNKRFRL